MERMGKNHGMLDGLEELGFNNVRDISLYEGEKDKQSLRGSLVNEKTEADYLFNTEVECPICHSGITVRRIKRSALRLQGRDTDSMPIYQHINPLFYEVWLCSQCGYAASESVFKQPLSKTEIESILKNISSRWHAKEYPSLYDADIAVERFKLALLSATVRKAKTIDIAMLCLKLGWVYRTKDDSENEIKCLNQALNGLKAVFDKGPFPVAGMDESSLAFLIGELSRRVGNHQEALDYFGRVITNRNTKNALKERARDQRQMIIKATQFTPDSGTTTPQKAAESDPPNKGLKGLFRRST